MEQQGTLDDTLARADVQLVRQPEQEIIFLGILQVEDVVVDDAYLADDRPCSLQFGERRERICTCGFVCRGRQAKAKENGAAA